MFKSWSVAQKCGAFLLCFLLAFAYLQPYFYPMDEAFQNLNKILQKPTALYWFGTDHFGFGNSLIFFVDFVICRLFIVVWFVIRYFGRLSRRLD